MLRTNMSGIVLGFAALFIGFGAQAQETTTTTVVEKKIIVTPSPKSVSCTTVSAHWEDNVWVDEQTVCKYEGRVEGVEWVKDYWVCTVFTEDGKCTTWEYRPGHWVQVKP